MATLQRFDGAAVWKTLDPDQQAAIGALALELIAAQHAAEGQGANDSADRLCRAANAAERLIVEELRETFVDAIPPEMLEDDGGNTKIPSLLGQVCHICGCSQDDACFPACSWVEDCLCSSCSGPDAILTLGSADRYEEMGSDDGYRPSPSSVFIELDEDDPPKHVPEASPSSS